MNSTPTTLSAAPQLSTLGAGPAPASAPRVSLAIPVHNEEQIVDELIARTTRVLDAIPGGPHEILLVDDGSSDGTLHKLELAAARDPRIVIVSLSRNFGHQVALSAALDHVEGDVVVVMDGDLQDPPEVIPEFLSKYHEGYDVVYSIRAKRQESWWLRASYYLFYRIIGALAEIRLPQGAGDFGLLSRRVVDVLKSASERHRYLRGLRTWAGFRQIGIPLNRPARQAGRSKYNLRRLFGLAFDGIFAFSVVPLRVSTLLGGLVVVLTLTYAAFALYARIMHDQSPPGFTTVILAIMLLGGIQMLILGIIGEYVGRIYVEVKNRPLYVVKKIVGRR
jgi:dolichol-phosphate mannosyltransferase